MIINVEGLDELSSLLKSCPKSIQKEVAADLRECLTDLEAKAMDIAPKDKGDLKGSAVMEVSTTSDGVEGMVGFDVPYATVQHERLDFHHEQGQAKYLERPMQTNLPVYIKSIEDAIDRGMKK